VEVLAEYLDGLGSVEQTRSIERHLADCDSCADLAQKLFARSAVLDGWTATNAKTAHDVKDAVETATAATAVAAQARLVAGS
jgi:anti-sigma factor RsiW